MLRLILTTLAIVVSGALTLAQSPEQTQFFYSITGGDSKSLVIADLSNVVGRECTKRIGVEINGSVLEVRYQPEKEALARSILSAVESSYKEAAILLKPVKLPSVKFYLLELDDPPPNFRIAEKYSGDRPYLHAHVLKKGEAATLDCRLENKLCTDIFQTIPHEITHIALSGLLGKGTRWFEEGLAEYVAGQTARKFAPEIDQARLDSYVPPVSLNRVEVRERIFGWKDLEGAEPKRQTEMYSRNEFFNYGAAREIISRVIERSKQSRIDDPLGKLLASLSTQQPVGSNRTAPPTATLAEMIKNDLRVDVRTIGKMPEELERSYFDDALNSLRRSGITARELYKALYVLASIDKFALLESDVFRLLDFVFKEPGDTFLPNLAAAAILRRLPESKDLIAKYARKADSSKSRLTASSIKRRLRQLSFRPEHD